MGWLSRLAGIEAKREREALAARGDEAREMVAALLREGDVDQALVAGSEALRLYPDHAPLLATVADVLLRGAEPRGAELLSKVAQAPGDPLLLADLGSYLLSRDAAPLAATFLSRAIDAVPFDAVLRSELALAQARSGEPGAAVATLVLHPCLADDPGVLFEFAWCSLLTFDFGAARGARDRLAAFPQAATLLRKLDCALARAEIAPMRRPADARDFFFLEHGGVLLDSAGEGRGRYAGVALTESRVSSLLGAAGAVFARILDRPRRFLPVDDAAQPLAVALADLAEGETVAAANRGTVVVVARDAADLEGSAVLTGSSNGMRHLAFALTLDWSRTVVRVPQVVGLMARRDHPLLGAGTHDPGPVAAESREGDDADLMAFVIPRLAVLPPRGPRVVSAYVPDAPLPWV